ncbi:MAG: polymer-forming cytoskeletal protein, partial [Myxococcota bacterium]
MVDNAASTVIGESILISGNLEGDEDLTILGRVEGSIKLTRTVMIEESGVVKADLTVRNAIVSGVVVGNISASDSVEITEAGRMVGDIRAP